MAQHRFSLALYASLRERGLILKDDPLEADLAAKNKRLICCRHFVEGHPKKMRDPVRFIDAFANIASVRDGKDWTRVLHPVDEPCDDEEEDDPPPSPAASPPPRLLSRNASLETVLGSCPAFTSLLRQAAGLDGAENSPTSPLPQSVFNQLAQDASRDEMLKHLATSVESLAGEVAALKLAVAESAAQVQVLKDNEARLTAHVEAKTPFSLRSLAGKASFLGHDTDFVDYLASSSYSFYLEELNGKAQTLDFWHVYVCGVLAFLKNSTPMEVLASDFGLTRTGFSDRLNRAAPILAKWADWYIKQYAQRIGVVARDANSKGPFSEQFGNHIGIAFDATLRVFIKI